MKLLTWWRGQGSQEVSGPFVSNRLCAAGLTHASAQRSALALSPPDHSSPSQQRPLCPHTQLYVTRAEPHTSPLLPVPEISLCRVNCARARLCPLGVLVFWLFFFLVQCRWCSRTLLCKAALYLKARHRTHVLSITNIWRLKAVCKENDGYCCLPSLGFEQPHGPSLASAALLAWDKDGDGQEQGCLSSLFRRERHELPS